MTLHKAGFTIIEFAVVIVVVGLLAGGIVTAKTMVRGAQLQSVLSDVDAYKKNIQTFKDKYYYLPGDFPKATSFWGTDSGCTNSAYVASPHLATCNGDGNGRISGYEMFRAWQHMADAGIIPGGYAGMSASQSANYAKIGANVPSSKLVRAGFNIVYEGPIDATSTLFFPGDYGHVIILGAEHTNDLSRGSVLSPSEAFMIDSKIDDGLPGTGNVTTSSQPDS